VKGKAGDVQLNQPYDLKVSFTGSKIELFFGEVKVIEANDPLPYLEGNVGLRVWEPSCAVEFENVVLYKKEPGCFVIMPFKEMYRELYDNFIKQILAQQGLETKRADEVFGTRPVIEDILENIVKSRLIVAFFTESNPNVLYEIGVAHALNKDVIILAPDVSTLPFDVRHRRCIPYENSLLGSEKLKSDLQQTVRHLLGKA